MATDMIARAMAAEALSGKESGGNSGGESGGGGNVSPGGFTLVCEFNDQNKLSSIPVDLSSFKELYVLSEWSYTGSNPPYLYYGDDIRFTPHTYYRADAGKSLCHYIDGYFGWECICATLSTGSGMIPQSNLLSFSDGFKDIKAFSIFNASPLSYLSIKIYAK